jgi:hypothetical protein
MPLGVKPGPASVRFVKGWHVPVGGLLLTGSGLYASSASRSTTSGTGCSART